jgi:hypothetical protein
MSRKKIPKGFILVMLISLLLMKKTYSQVLLPYHNTDFSGQFFLKIGLEPEIVTSIGYVKHFDIITSNFYYGATLKFAPMILKNMPVKFNLFLSREYQLSNKWFLIAIPQIYYVHNSDRAGTYNGIGFEAGGFFYYQTKKWTKGFELNFQNTTFTHIKFSEQAKETFRDRYPSGNSQGPRDGWYRFTASRFKLGYTTARKINDHLGMQFSFGGNLSSQKQHILLGFSHAQVPVYIEGIVRYKL